MTISVNSFTLTAGEEFIESLTLESEKRFEKDGEYTVVTRSFSCRSQPQENEGGDDGDGFLFLCEQHVRTTCTGEGAERIRMRIIETVTINDWSGKLIESGNHVYIFEFASADGAYMSLTWFRAIGKAILTTDFGGVDSTSTELDDVNDTDIEKILQRF